MVVNQIDYTYSIAFEFGFDFFSSGGVFRLKGEGRDWRWMGRGFSLRI